MREADRTGDADLLLDLAEQPHQHHRRRCAVQLLRAGKIEKCLVERQGLDRRRQFLHQRADDFRCRGIGLHSRLDDHGVRAQPAGPEHRHRRMHAPDSGNVAGSGDNAAPGAADNDRPVPQRRVVPLLDRGKEGVAIHVGDGEVEQFRMRENARRVATGTSASPFEYPFAISADCRHLSTCRLQAPIAVSMAGLHQAPQIWNCPARVVGPSGAGRY